MAKIVPSGTGSDVAVSKKQQKNIDLFFYGVLTNILSYITGITNNKYITPATCQGIQAIALAMVIFASVNLIKYKFENNYFKSVFTVFLIYLITIVIREPNFDYNAIKNLLFDPGLGIVPYFVPLVVLFPRSMVLYKKVFKTLVIFGTLFITYIIIYFDIVHDNNWLNLTSQAYIENFFGAFGIPVGFLALTFLYHSKKIRKFAFAVLVVALYFLIFRARRGSMFICLTTLTGAGMIYLVHTKRTVLVITLSVIMVLFGTVFVSDIKLPSMFDFLMSRKDEDTRTGMEVYMKADMTRNDWIIGKGINGKYVCPFILDASDLSGKRGIIETGYLQIILKGGLMELILFGLILLPAAYLGLFKSSNVLSKGAGMYLLLCAIYLYPTIVIGYGMYYIVIWIAVGICYSGRIRKMSDSTIQKYLQE